MIRIIIFISLVILSQNVYSQEVFQRSYGGPGNEYGRAVIECSTGGYLIVGSTNSYYNPSTDVYLLRVDVNGDYLWGRNIGNSNKIDWGIDLAEDGDGNFIIAGYTDDSPTGSYDGLVIKTNSEGQVIWKKTFGGDDWDFIESMSLNTADEIILAGSKTVNGIQKGWILKTDNDGQIIWERLIDSSSQLKITGVDVCGDQSIVFSGFASNSFLDTKKMVSGRLNAGGEINWVSSYSEIGKAETGKCICGENESLYSVGTVFHDEGTTDIFVNAIDINLGSVVWNNILGQTDAFGNGVTQKENGNVYFVGTIGGIGFNSYSANINSYTSVGGFLPPENTAILGGFGTDELFDIHFTNDGGLIAVGETNSFGNGYQVHLCKMDALGARDENNIDFLDLATSIIPRKEINNLAIYPNPSSKYINLDFNFTKEVAYSIITSSGRKVDEGIIKPTDEKSVNISTLENGVYFITLTESDKTNYYGRFIKLP